MELQGSSAPWGCPRAFHGLEPVEQPRKVFCKKLIRFRSTDTLSLKCVLLPPGWRQGCLACPPPPPCGEHLWLHLIRAWGSKAT